MDRQPIRVMTVLLMVGLLAVTTGGCGGTVAEQVGMVAIYEADSDDSSVEMKPFLPEMQLAVAVIDQRLKRDGRRLGRARELDIDRLEVSIFRKDPREMQRIADLLPRPGTLEFRILANVHDHKTVIERAKAEPNNAKVCDRDGTLLAWWVPVREKLAKRVGAREGIATRTVTRGDRKILEVLVLKDSFDVTGDYLKDVAVDKDPAGRPSVMLSFVSHGAQRLEALTAANLPDPDQGFHRTLGVICDGMLYSDSGITSKVSEQCRISGDFTREEVQDMVVLLNSGALPFAIHKVEQRLVEPEKQPSP
jgi:SecD/SecF fusion protein